MNELTFSEDYQILSDMIASTEEALLEERNDMKQLLAELIQLYANKRLMCAEHLEALEKMEGGQDEHKI